MIVSYEGITVEHNPGELYAQIYMPTLSDPIKHAVDCFNMEQNLNPTEMFLYMALKNWVKNNYATVYVNQ